MELPQEPLNSMTDDHILDKHKVWLICPKCRNFPLIEPLIIDNNFSIKIVCNCNSEPEILSVEDYLKLLQSKRTLGTFCDMRPEHDKYQAVTYCFDCDKWLCSFCFSFHSSMNKNHKTSDEEIHIDTKCQKHKEDNKITAYCKNCKVNLCQTCHDDHDHLHNIIKMNEYFTKQIAEEKKENFEKAKELYPEKETLKNELLNKIEKGDNEEEKKLKRDIQKAFNENKKINNDLIKLISYMFDNHFDTVENTPNYNIMTNLKNISRFNCTKFEIKEELSLEENAQNMINYFNGNFIIKIAETVFEKIDEKPYSGYGLSCICELPDNKFIAGNWNNTINIYDYGTLELIDSRIIHFEPVMTILVLNDGRLATGGRDFNIIIWNLSTFQPIKVLSGHEGPITKVIQLPSGELISTSWDKTIRLWNIEKGECSKILSEHTDKAVDVVLLNNGKIASCSYDGTVKIWELENFKCEHTIQFENCKLKCLLQLHDGRIAVGTSGRVKFIEVNNYKIEGELEIKDDPGNVIELKQLEDGRVGVRTDNKKIKMYRLEDSKMLFTIDSIVGDVGEFSQFKDGKILVENTTHSLLTILN